MFIGPNGQFPRANLIQPQLLSQLNQNHWLVLAQESPSLIHLCSQMLYALESMPLGGLPESPPPQISSHTPSHQNFRPFQH